ncbi:MAG: hypothetical protein ABSE59_03340 [Opitutaceae bacterium]
MASGLYLTLLMGPMVPVPAPKVLMDALTSVTVTVAAGQQSGFELSFTLADRSPLQTLMLLAGNTPMQVWRVVIAATVGGLPQVLMDGVVQHHEITPDAMTGSAKLTILGKDLTALMDLQQFPGLPFPGMSPDVRVLTMLGKYAAFGVAPMVVPVLAPDVPVPTSQIPSQQGTDFAYINQLAQENGYVFYLIPGPVPGASQAYWGPEVRIGVPQPALNVNMDSWTNVESLSFRYAPETAVTPIVYIQDETSGMTVPVPIPAVNPLSPPMGLAIPIPQRTEQMNNTAKLTPSQALMQGFARATQTGDVVSGDGTIDVLRYGQILYSRQLVGVRGAGLAFDGLYYVDSTTHQITKGKYKQSFKLKRNGLLANTPFVPTRPY